MNLTLGMDSAEGRRVAAPSLPDIREVFDEHAAFVLRSMRRMGVRDADVEDLAQEVFVVAHRKLAAYDGRGSMRSWLFGIVLRVSSSHRRRAHVRREVITARPPERTTDYCPAEANQMRALLEDALEALTERQRAVFLLFELEGLPMKEVADAVGIPLHTAYTRLRDGREKVRRRLTELLGEDSDE